MLPLLVRATLFAATTTAPPDAPALYVQLPASMSVEERYELLSACSSAYAAGECAAASSRPTDSRLLGRVEAEEGHRMLVQVTFDSERGKHSASRELTFVPEDEPLERAKTIGLTLGVVASGTLEEAAAPPAPAPEPEARTLTEAGSRPRWVVSLLGGVGRDPDLSSLEWGMAGRAELGKGASRYALRAGVAGFRSQDDARGLTLTRVDPTLGVGSRFAVGALEGGVALDVGLEWLNASVSRGGSNGDDDASRVTPLVRASFSVRNLVSDDFGVEVDGQASFTVSRTEIFVRGAEVDSTSGLQWALLAGGFVLLGN